jgi:hypothetical protein
MRDNDNSWTSFSFFRRVRRLMTSSFIWFVESDQFIFFGLIYWKRNRYIFLVFSVIGAFFFFFIIFNEKCKTSRGNDEITFGWINQFPYFFSFFLREEREGESLISWLMASIIPTTERKWPSNATVAPSSGCNRNSFHGSFHVIGRDAGVCVEMNFFQDATFRSMHSLLRLLVIMMG